MAGATIESRRAEAQREKERQLAKNPALAQLWAAAGKTPWVWGPLDWVTTPGVNGHRYRQALDDVLNWALVLGTPNGRDTFRDMWTFNAGILGVFRTNIVRDDRYPGGFAPVPVALFAQDVANALNLPYGTSVEDYYVWTPRQRLVDIATKVRAGIPDEKYWAAVKAIRSRAYDALSDAKRAPNRLLDEFLVALFRQPELTRRPCPVPHQSLMDSLVKLFKAAGDLFAKIANAAADGNVSLGEGLEIFGAASAVGKSLSGADRAKKKYLTERAAAGWFGPDPALWVQDDRALWELVRDLEI